MAALVGGTLAVVAGLARVTGFPGDYDAAQSSGAEWLATRSVRWEVWRDVATRDLVVFVPGYVVVGTAALVWAVPRRGLRVAAVASLLAAGAADVVETLLFRGTLDRFRDGATAAELATRTTVTAAFTVAKKGGIGLACLALAALVLVRPEDRDG